MHNDLGLAFFSPDAYKAWREARRNEYSDITKEIRKLKRDLTVHNHPSIPLPESDCTRAGSLRRQAAIMMNEAARLMNSADHSETHGRLMNLRKQASLIMAQRVEAKALAGAAFFYNHRFGKKN